MTVAATTLFPARRVITMEPNSPDATAVAISGDRVIAVGSLTALRDGGDGGVLAGAVLDETFADAVVCAGFIDQHLHPILGATTLATEVIAPEQWAVGGRTFPAADSEDAYGQAMRHAESTLIDPQSWLFSWGYHPLWHGRLDRPVLHGINRARPIAVWHRSCHEWFLNSAAIEELGITHDQMAGHDRACTMVDLDAGHWWETGMNLLVPRLAPVFMNADRMTMGLRALVRYLHSTGVTAFNEPGLMWDLEPWQLYQQILGAEDTPFLSTFLVDARSQADAGMDPADAVADAEAQVARACSGKVRLLPKQVKLFADGAIISQLMQMKEPYLDDVGRPDPHHHGEWMMQPNVFQAFAKVYWDAGWQLHVHVNGDAGLELVLDTIERCIAKHPRSDHRTVIVHFANSTEDQIDRIARVGAIVSANSYYPVGFADKYSQHGLGPDRADTMVRSASVLRRGIPLSFHSDLPMGPADPLALAWCAVNRRTPSGRIACPGQRVSVHDALRAITIEAAYSWRMEHELGSIAAGKLANFTILGEDPYAVEPERLDRIPVLGTVYAGRWFPASA
jgi:predicted amidohydrolase YtcJ